MKFHKLANLFPMLQDTEFQALVEDIRQNGQLHPIVLWESQILDGRNRWRACEKLNIEPKYTTFDGSDPFAFVVSLNLHRRHLSSSQRAAIALRFEEYFAEEAKERQREGGRTKVSQNIDEADPNDRRAAAKAAKLLRTNRTYVSTAKKLRALSPEIFQEVVEGRTTIHLALKQARNLHKEPVKPPVGKYEVLYVDPPWSYSTGGAIPAKMMVESHYSTMTNDEILEFGEQIKQVAAPDAAIFLWATNIYLPLALDLMERSGFTHRGQIIWNKTDKLALSGRWLSIKHELLLVGSRGNIEPSVKPPSVISTPRLKHSQKPETFASIINQMFPNQSKLEMFAREYREGWAVWGNEVTSTKEKEIK